MRIGESKLSEYNKARDQRQLGRDHHLRQEKKEQHSAAAETQFSKGITGQACSAHSNDCVDHSHFDRIPICQQEMIVGSFANVDAQHTEIIIRIPVFGNPLDRHCQNIPLLFEGS